MAGPTFLAQIPDASAPWKPATRAAIDLAPLARVLKLPLIGTWIAIDASTVLVGELVLAHVPPAGAQTPTPWPPAP